MSDAYKGHAGKKQFQRVLRMEVRAQPVDSHSSFILEEPHKDIGWQEFMQAQHITLVSSVFVDLCPFLHHWSSGPGGQNGMGWRITSLSSIYNVIQKSLHR